MFGKQVVKKSIAMKNPDYVPILYFNGNKEESDVVIIDVVQHFFGENKDKSEWGFSWEKHDDTMGQPKAELIKTWNDLKQVQVPDPFNKSRFAGVEDSMDRYKDKYYLASLVLSGFTVMSALRGFVNTLEDLYEEPEDLNLLADIVFGFEEKIISQLKSYEFDGVAFYDDWGTQSNLIISPAMWRSFFKPRYKKQFEFAHKNGLDVYFHSCGYIYDIIPDLIEIGVDMLNISQPNLYSIENLSKDFGGKTCFVCPVSYQTTAITGNKDDIFKEAKRLIDNLGKFDGGFIGYVEQYESIGMSDENYKSCIEAFKKYGHY
jgi:uroporphyrinogen decarboxylase